MEGMEVLTSVVLNQRASVVPDNLNDLIHVSIGQYSMMCRLTSPSLAGNVYVTGSQPLFASAAV